MMVTTFRKAIFRLMANGNGSSDLVFSGDFGRFTADCQRIDFVKHCSKVSAESDGKTTISGSSSGSVSISRASLSALKERCAVFRVISVSSDSNFLSFMDVSNSAVSRVLVLIRIQSHSTVLTNFKTVLNCRPQKAPDYKVPKRLINYGACFRGSGDCVSFNSRSPL